MPFIYTVRLCRTTHDNAFYVTIQTLKQSDGKPANESDFVSFSWKIEIPKNYKEKHNYKFSPGTPKLSTNEYDEYYKVELRAENTHESIQHSIIEYTIKRYEILEYTKLNSTTTTASATTTSTTQIIKSSSFSFNSNSTFTTNQTFQSIANPESTHFEGINNNLQASYCSEHKKQLHLDRVVMEAIDGADHFDQLTPRQIKTVVKKTISQAHILFGQNYSASATILICLIINGWTHTITLGNSLAFCIRKRKPGYEIKVRAGRENKNNRSPYQNSDQSDGDMSDNKSDLSDEDSTGNDLDNKQRYIVTRLNKDTNSYGAVGALPYDMVSTTPVHHRLRKKNNRQADISQELLPENDYDEKVILLMTTNNIIRTNNDTVTDMTQITNLASSRASRKLERDSNPSTPNRSRSQSRHIENDLDYTHYISKLLTDETDSNPKTFLKAATKDSRENSTVVCVQFDPKKNGIYGLFHGRVNASIVNKLSENFVSLLKQNLSQELKEDILNPNSSNTSPILSNSFSALSDSISANESSTSQLGHEKTNEEKLKSNSSITSPILSNSFSTLSDAISANESSTVQLGHEKTNESKKLNRKSSPPTQRRRRPESETPTTSPPPPQKKSPREFIKLRSGPSSLNTSTEASATRTPSTGLDLKTARRANHILSTAPSTVPASIMTIIKNIMGTLFSDQVVNPTQWLECDVKTELLACKLNAADNDASILRKWNKLKTLSESIVHGTGCIKLPCLNGTKPHTKTICHAIIDFDALTLNSNDNIDNYNTLMNTQIKLDFINFINQEISRLERSCLLTNFEPKVVAYSALKFELLDSIKNPKKSHTTLQNVYDQIKNKVVVYDTANKHISLCDDKQAKGGYKLWGNATAATFDEIIAWNRRRKNKLETVTSYEEFHKKLSDLNSIGALIIPPSNNLNNHAANLNNNTSNTSNPLTPITTTNTNVFAM